MPKIEQLNLDIQELIDEAIKSTDSNNNIAVLASVINAQSNLLQKIVDKQNEIIEAISIDKKYI